MLAHWVVLSCAIGAISAHPCAYIRGGQIAAEAAYRYQVSIRNKGNHICSGAIIDQRHILTSRYCVGTILVPDLSVIAGTNSLREAGTVFTAAMVILHTDLKNDIAIIRTTEEIQFDGRIESIALADHDYRESNTPIVISGWGSLIDGTLLTQLLQELHVKLFDQEQCMKRYGDIDESKFCTIEQCGTHLCHIDVGSPLVADGVLIGIKSLGYNCGLNRADMHVRVYHYLEWIQENIVIEPQITTSTTTALPITSECF